MVEKWFEEDPHIFAAFRSRYAEYNTLLIQFHKDIKNYELWREKLTVSEPLSLNNGYLKQTSTSIFLNDFMIKFNPNDPVYLLEEDLKINKKITINGYDLGNLDFKIIKLLLGGSCIKINESQISSELGIHRSTILRRIQSLMDEKLISSPVCRFPNFFTPPGYVLAVCRLDIKSNKEEFIKNIRNDPHVTLVYNTHSGGFNLLLFAAFKNLDEELKWELRYSTILPESLDKIDVRFYSLAGAIEMGHSNVSLSIRDQKYMYFRI
jgi:DNA-binding Lrp family transcriptional regulator